MPNDHYAKWPLFLMPIMSNDVMSNDLLPNGRLPNQRDFVKKEILEGSESFG